MKRDLAHLIFAYLVGVIGAGYGGWNAGYHDGIREGIRQQQQKQEERRPSHVPAEDHEEPEIMEC